MITNPPSSSQPFEAGATDGALVQPGAFLTLHYRIALHEIGLTEDIVNTFVDKPATLQLGQQHMAEGLEQCLLGMRTGERKVFDLLPEQAFGLRNPDLIQKVSRSLLDQHSDPESMYQPGDLVEFPVPVNASSNHQPGRFAGVLKEINEDYAVFDFNHPLAGKSVRFEAQIIGVLP